MQEAVFNIPTVRDIEFCVCMNGAMPVPSKLSIIFWDWFVTEENCRTEGEQYIVMER